jgi:predicted transport protein
MKTKTAEWFETKVKYEKEIEDGQTKTVTETYVVDALSFTEAETSIIEEASAYIAGEFSVTDIKHARYKEVIMSENSSDDRWFKAKVQFITIDEKTEKEKLTSVMYLVQSNTLQNAIKNVESVMNTGMQDWKLASITETSILDVFEHKAN